MKRIVSLLLSLALILGMMGTFATAEERPWFVSRS